MLSRLPNASRFDATLGNPQSGAERLGKARHLESIRPERFRTPARTSKAESDIVVYTLGMLLAVTIIAASMQDRDHAAPVVGHACTKVLGLNA